MKFNLEQARERSVGYLYGELAGDELRAFEAALRESVELAREVDALKQTLSLTRETLRVRNEEPPKGAREAVLAAARAQARANSVAEESPRTQRTRALEPKRSPWSFLRTPWLFPAFGVCAAIAFVVVRERREEREIAGAPPPAAAPTAAPSEQQPERDDLPKGVPAPDLLRTERSEKREATGELRKRTGGGGADQGKGAVAGRSADPFPAESAARAARKSSASPAPAAQSADERMEAEGAAPAEPFPGALAAEQSTRERPSDDAPQAVAVTQSRESRVEERAPTAPASSGARPAPAKAAPARRSSSDSAAAPREDRPLGALGSAPEAAGGAEAKKPKAAPADAAGKLVARALEAQKAGRHREALALYRELLGRFPGDARAPSWRRELRRSEQALAPRDARAVDD